MNILILRVPDGPGRWVGADGCLEHDLKSSRSNLRSKTVKTIILLGIPLNRDSRAHLIVGYEDHICWVCLIKKLRYLVHMNHNPMNSNPNRATLCRDPLAKTYKIVINLFLSHKMRSALALSNIEVMCSVHRDYIWTRLPTGTLSVGFEQQFVEGIMPFTFAGPRIVINSLFSAWYFLKKNKTPIFSRPHSLKVVGARKYGGFCFLWYSSAWKDDLSQFCRFLLMNTTLP